MVEVGWTSLQIERYFTRALGVNLWSFWGDIVYMMGNLFQANLATDLLVVVVVFTGCIALFGCEVSFPVLLALCCLLRAWSERKEGCADCVAAVACTE